jgi:hypothetical protein
MTAAERAFLAFVQEADTDQLECRLGRRHVWAGITDVKRTTVTGTGTRGVYEIETSCLRCGARLWRLSRAGYVDEGVPRRTHYPRGYAAPEGSGAIAYPDQRAMTELELIRRRGMRFSETEKEAVA